MAMTGQRHISVRILRVMLLACIGLLLVAQSAPDSPPAPAPDSSTQPAAKPTGPVYVISMTGEVNDIMRDRLKRQAAEAQQAGASAIVLRMDTWGGLVTSALEMCDFLKSLRTPTIAWVKPKAISAGAMISLACDQIIISDPARIGDCMPISGTGEPIGPAEREKVETVIRGEFRDSGKRNGYPLVLCTAMVTRGPAVYEIQHDTDNTIRYVFSTELVAYGIPDAQAAATPAAPATPPDTDPAQHTTSDQNPINRALRQLTGTGEDDQTPAPQPAADTPAVADPASMELPYDPGKWRIVRQVVAEKQLFTMVGNEPLQYGFAKKRVVDEAGLAQYLQVPQASITLLQANWSEKLVDFLTSPLIRGLLTIILLMALYSEMHSPGLGLAGAVALVAGALLLGAPYLAGLANMWELLLILAGVILLAIELFVIPGFGVVGFTGIALMFIGLLLTFVPKEPGPDFIPQLQGTWDALTNGFLILITSSVVAVVGMVILARFLGSMPLLNRLILSDEGLTEPPATGPETFGPATATDKLTTVKVGDRGRALSDLRPAGRAQFGPVSADVVTDGAWIESGSSIIIHTIAGNRVVVRKT